MRLPRAFNLLTEWVGFRLELLQPLPQRRMGRFSESAAGIAHVHQLAILIVQSQHDRAEVLARSPGIGIAGYHALLPARDLDLQPLARTLPHVWTGAELGHDPLQSLIASHRVERFAMLRVMIGVANEAFFGR